MNITITISLGDVTLLATALRHEISRHDGNRKRCLRSAALIRAEGRSLSSDLRSEAVERRADTHAALAERCTDLLKTLP
jgi:hypothetical protein